MSGNTTDVRLAVHYRRTWEDGFGARGWKLACATEDPEVIGSTAATGERIPTSVFVHDILDHFLCGLGTSGHRNEAVALLQLAARTGTDPTPDFAQMVDEDLMQGRVIGERLATFLPAGLTDGLPTRLHDAPAIVAWLRARLGDEVLRERLIARLFELGEAGTGAARERFADCGLDYSRRGRLGLALQRLLEQADAVAQRGNWATATADVWITPRRCGFEIHEPQRWRSELAY